MSSRIMESLSTAGAGRATIKKEETLMANPFVHMELSTPDLTKAKEFYTKLFNWTITDNDMGGGMVYSMFKPDSGPGGGMFTMPGSPTGWLAYVGVDDINS